jgi:hypothetical protein
MRIGVAVGIASRLLREESLKELHNSTVRVPCPPPEALRRFYPNQHPLYCGIDLHAHTMYVCLLRQDGEVVLHRNRPARPDALLKAIAPYRDDMVIAVECIFTWYWLADLCAQEGLPFVRGHALYMQAIHGGKAKNDKIDSQKSAVLLRGGMLPQA